MSQTFYGGISRSGKHHTLVINGRDWNWKKSPFTNDRFNHIAIGANFTIEHTLDDKTLTVEWETLNFDGTYQDDVDIKEYLINDAAQKKNRSLASVKKKMDFENIQNLTVRELKEIGWSMNKTQKAALIALVLAEVGY